MARAPGRGRRPISTWSPRTGGCRRTSWTTPCWPSPAGEHDVLLTTSIIETGLDIPGADTMIVWRPERFGVAQLHQLRGRVGRGPRARGRATCCTSPDAPAGRGGRAAAADAGHLRGPGRRLRDQRARPRPAGCRRPRRRGAGRARAADRHRALPAPARAGAAPRARRGRGRGLVARAAARRRRADPGRLRARARAAAGALRQARPAGGPGAGGRSRGRDRRPFRRSRRRRCG